MAFAVDLFIFLLHIKLPEEVERYDGVDIHDDGQQHHGQYQLFAIVRYGLQDGAKGLETNRHVEQMGGKEEIIEIAEYREHKVPQGVEERVVRKRDSGLPDLVAPVDIDDTEKNQRNIKCFCVKSIK